MDWQELDLSPLFEAIRADTPAPDAERMVWALEQMLRGARIDPGLLDHLAVAAVSRAPPTETATHRGAVLERLFRRAVGDDRWNAEYAELIEI